MNGSTLTVFACGGKEVLLMHLHLHLFHIWQWLVQMFPIRGYRPPVFFGG